MVRGGGLTYSQRGWSASTIQEYRIWDSPGDAQKGAFGHTSVGVTPNGCSFAVHVVVGGVSPVKCRCDWALTLAWLARVDKSLNNPLGLSDT